MESTSERPAVRQADKIATLSKPVMILDKSWHLRAGGGEASATVVLARA